MRSGPTSTHIEELLDQLVADSGVRAVAFHGLWGVGKTYRTQQHFAKRTVRGELAAKKLGYAYVSLFGMQSIAQLRSRICASALDAQGNKAFRVVMEQVSKVTGGAGVYKVDLTAIGDLANEIIERRTLRGLVVCFDDLERAEGLALTHVFGLMSELIEQHDCKCVVLFNEARFNEQQRAELRKQDEKLFDLRVEFAPLVADNLPVSNIDPANRALVAPVFEAFGIANIRIMRRLGWVLRRLAAFEKGCSAPVWSVLVRHAAVLTILRHAYGEQIPDLAAAVEKKSIASVIFGAPDAIAGLPKDLHASVKQLDFRPSEVDLPIIGLLETGHLDVLALQVAMHQEREKAENQSVQLQYAELVDSLRESFKQPTSTMVQRLRDFLGKPTPGLPTSARVELVDLLLRLDSSEKSMRLAEAVATPWLVGMPADVRAKQLPKYPALAAAAFVNATPTKAVRSKRTLKQAVDAIAAREDGCDPAAYADLIGYTAVQLLAEIESPERPDPVIVFARICEHLSKTRRSEIVVPLAATLEGVAEAIRKRGKLQAVQIDIFVADRLKRLTSCGTRAAATPEPQAQLTLRS